MKKNYWILGSAALALLGTALPSTSHAYSTYKRVFKGKVFTFQRDVELGEAFISSEIGTEGVGLSMGRDGVLCDFTKGWAHLAMYVESDFFGPNAKILDKGLEYEVIAEERNYSRLRDSEGYNGTIEVILRLQARDAFVRPSQVFLHCWSSNFESKEENRLYMAEFDLLRALNQKESVVKITNGPDFHELPKSQQPQPQSSPSSTP